MSTVETELQDGIYPGMTRSRYGAIEAASYSKLKNFERSAAHAREYMLHPSEPTESMDFGSASHCCILEPERFASDYVAAPKVDRRTKEGKNAWNEFEDLNRDKEILSAEDMELCTEMAAAVRLHPFVRDLLSAPGKNEVCVVWTDPVTHLRCKALIDRICTLAGHTFVLDFKTTQNATPNLFASQAARLQYHVQAAHYLNGLNTLAPVPRKWLWIAQEKTRPYCSAVYRATPEVLSVGEALIDHYLEQLAECQQTNIWPGYPTGMQDLRLPRWAWTEEV